MADHPPPNVSNTSITLPEDQPRVAMTEGTMDDHVRQLALKLNEQEVSIAALRDDMKALKKLLNGDRKDNRESSSYLYAKNKQLSGLLDNVKDGAAALKEQLDGAATKAELQAVSQQLDDLRRKQEGTSTKTEVQTLSEQVDNLRTHIDRITPGIHAAASPPNPDLIAFSPGCLINLGDIARSPERLPVPSNKHTPTRALSSRIGAVPALSQPQPDLAEDGHHEGDQAEHPQKRVKFEAGTKKGGIASSDFGSEDPLAPDATLRRRVPSKKRMSQTPTVQMTKPHTTKNTEKVSRPQASVFLDRFKSGHLIDDSDDEDRPALQLPTSDDTDSTIVVAAKAVNTARAAQRSEITAKVTATATSTAKAQREAAVERPAIKESVARKPSQPQPSAPKKPSEPQQPTASKSSQTQQSTAKTLPQTQQEPTKKPSEQQQTAVKKPSQRQQSETSKPSEAQQAADRRKSSRAPKPRDFGDVEVHGWKYRAKGS